MKKLTRAIAFAVFGLAASVSTAQAADITSYTMRVKGNPVRYLHLEGDIKQGDAKKLEKLINRYDRTDMPVELLTLDSKGGNLGESVELMSVIDEYKIATAVRNTDTCLSACLGVYAAGPERVILHGATVGVEGIKMRDENSGAARAAMDELMGLYEELDISKSIRNMMLTLPEGKIYILDDSEKMYLSSKVSKFKWILPKSVQIDPKLAERAYYGGRTKDGKWAGYDKKSTAAPSESKWPSLAESTQNASEERNFNHMTMPDINSGAYGNEKKPKHYLP